MDAEKKELSGYLPFWEKLTQQEREKLAASVLVKAYPKGSVLHRGSEDCVGLLLIITGQPRAFILSEDGKELTLYRLLERDMCLFPLPAC